MRHVFVRPRLAALFCVLLSACGDPADTVRIGVAMPLGSGDVNFETRAVLEWAAARVNAAGGVAGQPLELVYADTSQGYAEVTGRLIRDPTIQAVIGPARSSEFFQMARLALRHETVIVSPTSTSADIYRAYAGKPYVWRTTESDAAQLAFLLQLARELTDDEPSTSISLVTSFDQYGATFFDSFGFLATEYGLEVGEAVRYRKWAPGQDEEARGAWRRACDEAVDLALGVSSGEPVQVVIAIPSTNQDAACIARRVRTHPGVKLLFADSAHSSSLLEAVDDPQGLQGSSPAPAPDSGFEAEYVEQCVKPSGDGCALPVAFAANQYDALYLLALGLERSGGEGGAALQRALVEITSSAPHPEHCDSAGSRAPGAEDDAAWMAREAVGFDEAGVARALARIAAGELPRVRGATGWLRYDPCEHTDLNNARYVHWRVSSSGEFTLSWPAFQEAGDTQASLVGHVGSAALREDLRGSEDAPMAVRAGLRAVILAASIGRENYRHQADAMAVYDVLTGNGVHPDDITLVSADEFAEVRNVAGGRDLRAEGSVDFGLRVANACEGDGPPCLDLDGFLSQALGGLGSTEADDVLLFLVGHGGRQGLYFGAAREQDAFAASRTLGPNELRRTVESMAFRRMLIVVEACHGGILAEGIEGLDNVLLLSGANAHEDSLATHYDADAELWRADAFAYAFEQWARARPEASLANTYDALYLRVPGSHVSIYNYARFPSVQQQRLRDFVAP